MSGSCIIMKSWWFSVEHITERIMAQAMPTKKKWRGRWMIYHETNPIFLPHPSCTKIPSRFSSWSNLTVELLFISSSRQLWSGFLVLQKEQSTESHVCLDCTALTFLLQSGRWAYNSRRFWPWCIPHSIISTQIVTAASRITNCHLMHSYQTSWVTIEQWNQ